MVLLGRNFREAQLRFCSVFTLRKNFGQRILYSNCFSNTKPVWLKEGKLIRDLQLTPNERAKHVYYMQRATDEVLLLTTCQTLC